ncbi:MAG: peptidoglycan-associated lipoprotein Pal [Alphaproteobacteria bacterium]|nr:peptidoglycan-associated lipoprotein Pal [Alphaproteobacteria bacterium]
MAFKSWCLVSLVVALIGCAGDPPPDAARGAGGGIDQSAAGLNRGGAIDGDAANIGRNGHAPKTGPGSQQDLAQTAGDRVFFDTDKVELKAEGRQTLARQAEWLTRYRNVVVTIEGHADERGLREYNLALGERRAQTVKNVLIGLGIEAGRISTVSYGKERPAVVGSNEAAWAQNRRAVTTVE